MPNEPNIRGQINRAQFLVSLGAGLFAGAAATLLHLQNSAPDWAGGYTQIVIVVISSLMTGLGFLKSGNQADEQGE